MLPLPLIMVIGLAILTVVIMLMIFRQLGQQEKDSNKQTLKVNNFKDEQLKKANATIDALKEENSATAKELAKLKKELAERVQFCENLNAKFEQAQQKDQQREDQERQLEQLRNQVREQVIKYKKLEKDLDAKKDELAALEQKHQKSEQDVMGLKKELNDIKIELGREKVSKKELETKIKEEEKPAGLQDLKETAKPEQAQEEPKPQKAPEPQKPPAPQKSEEPKAKEPQPEKPKDQQKKEESPFSRFLRPKTTEEENEGQPE